MFLSQFCSAECIITKKAEQRSITSIEVNYISTRMEFEKDRRLTELSYQEISSNECAKPACNVAIPIDKTTRTNQSGQQRELSSLVSLRVGKTADSEEIEKATLAPTQKPRHLLIV